MRLTHALLALTVALVTTNASYTSRLPLFLRRFAENAHFKNLASCAKPCVFHVLTDHKPWSCPRNTPGCFCARPSFHKAIASCVKATCAHPDNPGLTETKLGAAKDWGRDFCHRVESWHKGGYQALMQKGVTVLLCWKGGPAEDKHGNCPPRPTWRGCKLLGYC